MTARYAIYYAPRGDTPLWRKASAWLGRDAYTGQALARPSLASLEGLDLDALTADPRGYGFHATLKAPFALAPGAIESELLSAAAAFVAGQSPFEAAIAPAALGRFLAFRLEATAPRMQELHAACVRVFEPFRAPLGEHDLARRRKTPLTPEQDSRLAAWGYPYVFEDFRFHMTLTGPIAEEALRARVLEALRDHFAAETGPHRFDGVAVFKQADRAQPFDIIQRFDFRAAVSQKA
jgi:putative phosphonate metabolism protein